MEKAEALALIAVKIKEAETALAEAAKTADENGVSFRWNGPDYGMGGWYDEDGWNPSSQSC